LKSCFISVRSVCGCAHSRLFDNPINEYVKLKLVAHQTPTADILKPKEEKPF